MAMGYAAGAVAGAAGSADAIARGLEERPMDERTLAGLYGRPDDCPGGYRFVHKLPALPADLRDPLQVDGAVADALVAHGDFVADIARLTAAALLQVHGADAAIPAEAVRDTAAQVATSLAVALLRRPVLEQAIRSSIGEQGAFGQAWLSCPE